MRYSLLVVLAVALLLNGCSMWKEHPATAWSDVTGGESLERVFWQELKAKNWNAIDQHLAGNFVAITPHGQFDHAAFLDHLKQVQLDDYSLGDLQVEMNTHTLVVTYTVMMHGTVGGQALPAGPVRMMSVWQQQKPDWIQIAHTVIGPP